ncbi:MAG TPA: hypothetical protein VGG65_06785, partial [Thermoanaerobaculia bacterium]
MSSAPLPGMKPLAGARRHGWLALTCFGLAAAAGVCFGRDLALRRRASALLEQAGLAAEPANLESLALSERGDAAAAFAAEAVLAELAPAGGSSGAVARYGPSAGKLLAATRDMALVAVDERPGWAPNQLLLARAEYAVWDLTSKPEPNAVRAWMGAFRGAGVLAPGLDLASFEAADAALAGWTRLSAPDREDCKPILRRAFLSAEYV